MAAVMLRHSSFSRRAAFMISPTRQTDQSSRLMLPLLVVLNLLPMVGVVSWGWQSFDLIFLYWMENVVIGLFTLGRMVARRYGHAIEFAYPLFFAPFFALHYGGFSWGHGTFVVSLFAPDEMQSTGLWEAVAHILQSDQMLMALAALVLIQLLDWVRDIRVQGLGADDLKDLMTKPYRRIVVLHLTIIGSGFALGAMDEPLAGLVLLVVLKTAFDLWHWRKDSAAETQGEAFELSAEKIAELEAEYPHPMVKVNGREIRFDSFEAMKASKEFRFAMALMRLVGAGNDLRVLQSYMDMRIAREQRLSAR